MEITTREIFSAALKANNQDQEALFRQMYSELNALLVRYADASGKIPFARGQALRQDARAIILRYFVTERQASPDERTTETNRLHALIEIAQKQLRGSTDRQKLEISNRVAMLAARLESLERRGLILECIDAKGIGTTPYARALVRRLSSLVEGVIKTHQDAIGRLTNGS
jgi:hypothetical protein